jgi:hypothetical protein
MLPVSATPRPLVTVVEATTPTATPRADSQPMVLREPLATEGSPIPPFASSPASEASHDSSTRPPQGSATQPQTPHEPIGPSRFTDAEYNQGQSFKTVWCGHARSHEARDNFKRDISFRSSLLEAVDLPPELYWIDVALVQRHSTELTTMDDSLVKQVPDRSYVRALQLRAGVWEDSKARPFRGSPFSQAPPQEREPTDEQWRNLGDIASPGNNPLRDQRLPPGPRVAPHPAASEAHLTESKDSPRQCAEWVWPPVLPTVLTNSSNPDYYTIKQVTRCAQEDRSGRQQLTRSIYTSEVHYAYDTARRDNRLLALSFQLGTSMARNLEIPEGLVSGDASEARKTWRDWDVGPLTERPPPRSTLAQLPLRGHQPL